MTDEIPDGPRACRDYELAPLLDLLNRVFRIDEGRTANFGLSWPHIYRTSNLDNIRVVKLGHQIVSTITIFPTEARVSDVTLRIGGINGVATDADHRKRGFAGQILRQCHDKMRADGHDIGLLTTLSQDWYRRFDWEYGALQRTFTIDRGNAPYLPRLTDARVHLATERDLPAIKALHDTSPLGVVRDLERWAILIFRPDFRTYVARRGDETLAYAVVRGSGVAGVAVWEYGGQPDHAIGLIRAAFELNDDPSVSTSTRVIRSASPTPRWQVFAPARLDDTADRLAALGLPCNHDYPGMLYVVNPTQLLAKVAPRLEVAETPEGVTLRDGANRRTFTRRELVKLVFGPERTPDFAADFFPIPFHQWKLDVV